MKKRMDERLKPAPHRPPRLVAWIHGEYGEYGVDTGQMYPEWSSGIMDELMKLFEVLAGRV